MSEERVVALLAVLACGLAAVTVLEARALFDPERSGGIQIAEKRQLNVPAVLPATPWPAVADASPGGGSMFAATAPSLPADMTAPMPQLSLEPYSLMAIVIAPSREIAIVRSIQSGQIEQCDEGSLVGGWTVLAIEPDHIVLEARGQTATLYLPDTLPQSSN